MTYNRVMKKQQGFTLVELSIVLVIVGLVAGGIFAGQGLIRASQLRAITTEYTRFVTAAGAFETKYGALPGDMPNAQTFWGAQDADPATCYNSASTGTATCNGDGNGRINANYSTGSNEVFRMWQHLVNAKMIEGQYDGIQHGSAVGTTKANAPTSKFSPGMWGIRDYGIQQNNVGLYNGKYDNSLLFAKVDASNNQWDPILVPEDAASIDKKIDDGKPGTGKLVASSRNGPSDINCTDTPYNGQNTGQYVNTNKNVSCFLIFREVF